MALVVLVAATVLVAIRRMPAFPTYVGTVLATLLLPLVGPVIGLALVITCMARTRPGPAQNAPCPTCGHA